MNRPRIEITAPAYLGAAAGVLLLPVHLLLCAVLAAAFHEFCHYLALKICKIRILELKIGFFGARITTGPLKPTQEIICAAAGPVGSLSFLIFAQIAPVLSVFGLFQGLFNLLPIYPLDGGRILRCVIEILKEKSLAKNGSWRYNSPD